MPIMKLHEWQTHVDANQDAYGGACVKVAERVMELLDAGAGDGFVPSDVIIHASKQVKTDGITGYMAGCVASMVSECHSRGDEFRRKWNLENQIGTEGERANEAGTVLNPALLTIMAK